MNETANVFAASEVRAVADAAVTAPQFPRKSMTFSVEAVVQYVSTSINRRSVSAVGILPVLGLSKIWRIIVGHARVVG